MKNIYFISEFGENCNEIRNKKFINEIQKEFKKIKVILINPNWYKTLKENIFKPNKNSIIIGFSCVAVLTYLIAKKI